MKTQRPFKAHTLFKDSSYLLLLLVVISVSVLAYRIVYSEGIDQLNQLSTQRMNLYASQLKEQFGHKQRYIIHVMKKSRAVNEFFQQPSTANKIQARVFLKNIADEQSGEFAVIASGDDIVFSDTIAPELAQQLIPDLTQLRYTAFKGRSAFAFTAIDTRPFYLFGAPIDKAADGSVRGVLAVVVDLSEIQRHMVTDWSLQSEVVFVSDAYGLIVLSSRESWRYQAINRIPYGVKKRLNEQNRGLERGHYSLGIAQVEQDTGLVKLLNIHTPDGAPVGSYLSNSIVLPELHLRVHHLVDSSSAHRQAQIYAIGLASFSAVIVLLLFYMRANRLRAKLAAEREEILAKSEAHKNNIINASGSGLISFYTDGHIESMNSTCSALFNVDNPSPMAHLKQLFTDQHLIYQLSNVSGYLQHFRDREVVACRADGSQFSAQISVKIMQQEAPQLWLMTLLDITEQKNNEDERRKNQKMIAMGMMSATVAHEINQPLTAIKTEAAIALKLVQRKQLEKSTQSLQLITEFATSIANITSQLKSFSRMNTAVMHESANLYAVIQAVHVLFKSRLEKEHIRWREQLHDYDIKLNISPHELQQILTNLVQNACDAMATCTRKDLSIRVCLHGHNAVITLSDSGHGISAEHLDKIFEPFVSTKSNHGGLGLGLAICADIIARVGGDICVESNEQGTCFTLTLRLAE